MKPINRNHKAFTLIELLVVISVVGLLVSILLPSLGRARKQARSVVCETHLRSLGQAWGMYADENHGVLLPGRLPRHHQGGFANPENHYSVSTGMKYRPRWPVLMQAQVGTPAIVKPKTYRDRQNYISAVYVCPSVSRWTDERNAAYGYNYQFLGNHRRSHGQFRNLPVLKSQIRDFTGTVVAGDCNGSAAAFPTRQRLPYGNADREPRQRGNYGWLLDPPRLKPGSSRAAGRGSHRSGPDARHRNKANVVFADAHVELSTLEHLGYGVLSNGQVVEHGHGAHNRLFSGTGKDSAPP